MLNIIGWSILDWRYSLFDLNQNNFLQWINPGAQIFRKSYQSFLRIEFSDQESVNQKFLRPYDISMPAKIMIRNDEYKRFRNITVQTKVCFQKAYDLKNFRIFIQQWKVLFLYPIERFLLDFEREKLRKTIHIYWKLLRQKGIILH